MFSNGLQLMLLFVRDVNTRVLGYLGLVWPTRVPWNQRSAQLPRSPSSKYCIGCSRKREAAHVLIACSSPTQFTVVSSCMWWSGCKLAGVDTVHAFIYVRRVGFVKYHEWRVACNRPTLVCPRKIAAQYLLKSHCIWPLSPAVSLWCHNYTGVSLRCQSYQGTVKLQ